MTRQATPNDIPALVELGAEMHAESPVFSRMRFDAERLATTIGNAIAMPNAFARVHERDGRVVGGMLAMVTQHWFSSDAVACDLALFVAKQHRGGMAGARLLSEYIAWARSSGAAIVQLGITTGINPDKTEALCRRLGGWRAGVVMEF